MNYKLLATLLTLLLFIASSFHVSASRRALSDLINNVKNEHGLALASATVTIKELHKIGIINENGEFVLRRIHNGRYQVEISFVGYEHYQTEIEVTEDIFRLTAELKLISLAPRKYRVYTVGHPERFSYIQRIKPKTRMNVTCLEDVAFYSLIEMVVERLKETQRIREEKWIPAWRP